ENVLINVECLQHGAICHGSWQDPNVSRTLTRQFLKRRLLTDGSPVNPTSRHTFGEKRSKIVVDGYSAALTRMITKCRHVYSMAHHAGPDADSLNRANFLHQFTQ